MHSFFAEKVERELERLVALRIIEPVQYAEWAAPIVCVLKKDENKSICTVNSLKAKPLSLS